MKIVYAICSKLIPFMLLLQLGQGVSAQDHEKVLEPLKKLRPDFKFESVEPSQVEGIYKANIERGPTIYLTEDGRYFFAGDFFEVGDTGLINIAEKELESERKGLLAEVALDDMIIFGAENKKAHIYVFTDVDCYYCQKLHREMEEMNSLGIEVRYLAYPRAGIGSPSYNKVASAWCAEEPNEALTRLKAGKEIPENVCEGNPIAAQYDLGGRLGVSGTPALVTEDGKLFPGYKPAEQLAKALGL